MLWISTLAHLGFSRKYLCLLLLGGFSTASVRAEAPANQLTDSEKRSGWQLLFDGHSFDGWRNYKQPDVSEGWKIIDGAIVRTDQDGRVGDLITKKKFDHFELQLEYRISPGGNSGVMFHVVEGEGPPWRSGPEIQIQDNVDGRDQQKAGWLYQLYKPVPPKWVADQSIPDATRPAGQWNQLYLRIGEQNCEVVLNGIAYYTFRLGSKDWKRRVAESKFAKFEQFAAAETGHLCLQDHGDVVAFRNLKIRETDGEDDVPQPIDGDLSMKRTLAFPDLQWEDWEPLDDAGRIRPLRLMELTYANDDSNRLYAVAQRGMIWSFDNDPDVSESTLWLDLSDRVSDWKKGGNNEQGLLGFAPHPDFKSNGTVYVYYYSADQPETILSSFQLDPQDPSRADPDSEKVIMRIDQPFGNHNGGSIEFGPDGYLYIALGDGGDRNDPHANGQDLSTLLGSILRIDIDRAVDGNAYGIPSDNPFVDRPGARPEIFAYGVRNPWRIAFDDPTGLLFAGEVGQDRWEEILVIKKGGNYGWSVREGTQPFGNRGQVEGVGEPIAPVWEYDHLIGRSVTGGRVYRSDRATKLVGKYLYADYITGTVWALSFDPATGRATRNEQVTPESVAALAFGQDQNGEVFLLTDSTRGECIYRFE